MAQGDEAIELLNRIIKEHCVEENCDGCNIDKDICNEMARHYDKYLSKRVN